MKVLFACKNTLNDFVVNLKNSLYVDESVELVHIGYDFLERSPVSYDIVHFHWEDMLTETFSRKWPTIRARFDEWKTKGAKLLLTRHNRFRHGDKSDHHSELKQELYKSLDCMIHMSRESQRDFDTEQLDDLPQLRHEIIPHLNYENLSNETTRSEARAVLDIPDQTKVLLVFGGVRTNTERKFISEIFDQIEPENKLLIVPRWNGGTPPILQRIFNKLGVVKRQPANRRVFNRFIHAEDVQLYFNSADAVLIPRIGASSLNSGVVPLALTFGTPLVGPLQGSIGEILEAVNCPTFPPGDTARAKEAVESAFQFTEAQRKSLKEYSEVNLNHRKIGQLHTLLYKSLLNG